LGLALAPATAQAQQPGLPSGLELSAGVYRWLKAEYQHTASRSLQVGGWVDFPPLLISMSTVGLFATKTKHDSSGTHALRAGAGYAFGVLGDNIAGHGIEGSGEGAQGFLLEFETARTTRRREKNPRVLQAGALVTVLRSAWSARATVSVVPYVGAGLRTHREHVDGFLVGRLTFILPGGMVFPDAQIGFLIH